MFEPFLQRLHDRRTVVDIVRREKLLLDQKDERVRLVASQPKDLIWVDHRLNIFPSSSFDL